MIRSAMTKSNRQSVKSQDEPQASTMAIAYLCLKHAITQPMAVQAFKRMDIDAIAACEKEALWWNVIINGPLRT